MGGTRRRHSLPRRSSCRMCSAATMRLLLVALALGCAGAEGGRPRARHSKRGALGGLPPYKLGHDIPVVTHSVLKPLVVTYPSTATVSAVKVPLAHPLLPRRPPRHPLPSPHKHHHHHTKTVLLPHPEQHFHHHHHHVAPRPPLPVLPAAQPAATVVRSLPPPPPAPVTPLLPAATAPVPVTPLLPAPAPALVPLAPQYSYVIRPGNAVQTSYFATYPRYPLASYRPLAPTPALTLLPQPPAVHFQAHAAPPILAVAPTPTFLQAAEVPQAAIQAHNTQSESHAYIAPSGAHALKSDGWAPLGTGHSLFTQEAGTHVYEQHDAGEQALGGYPEPEQHIQQQFEQAHYDHHQLGHENAAPSAEYGQPGQGYDQHLLQHQQQRDHQYSQQYSPQEPFPRHDQQFAQHDQQFAQHDQQFAQHDQQFAQHDQQFAQHDQQFAQHDQRHAQHDQHLYEQQYAQHIEQHQQHLAASFEEQELQGRSTEEGEQRFHNHIPLGLQPPIDRPLDHFR